MREAVLTVSPNRQYRGMVRPTTPATTGPVWMPMRSFSVSFGRNRVRSCTISSRLLAYFSIISIIWSMMFFDLPPRIRFNRFLCETVRKPLRKMRTTRLSRAHHHHRATYRMLGKSGRRSAFSSQQSRMQLIT
uniref:Uncharacterized protein n=1 Tax=Anopheles farauti TaxID=69004 RepID=A0A182QHN5_9DIPT